MSVTSTTVPLPIADDSIKKSRAGLLAICKISTSYGFTPTPGLMQYVICSCCGSMILNKDGTVQHNNISTNIKPDREAVIDYYKDRYGDEVAIRFGARDYEEVISRMVRTDQPGVIFAYMDKASAIKIMYPNTADAADGYDIEDEILGKCSVIWLNQ